MISSGYATTKLSRSRDKLLPHDTTLPQDRYHLAVVHRSERLTRPLNRLLTGCVRCYSRIYC